MVETPRQLPTKHMSPSVVDYLIYSKRTPPMSLFSYPEPCLVHSNMENPFVSHYSEFLLSSLSVCLSVLLVVFGDPLCL